MPAIGARSNINWNTPIFRDVPEPSVTKLSRHYPVRLSEEEAKKVHEMYYLGKSTKFISEYIGCTQANVYAILQGRSFPHLISQENKGKPLWKLRKIKHPCPVRK